MEILSPGFPKILPAKDRELDSGRLAKTILSYTKLDSRTKGERKINSPFLIVGAIDESVNLWGNRRKERVR
jgi:hypothetical protein